MNVLKFSLRRSRLFQTIPPDLPQPARDLGDGDGVGVVSDEAQEEGAILLQVRIEEPLHELLVEFALEQTLLLQVVRHELEAVTAEDEAADEKQFKV